MVSTINTWDDLYVVQTQFSLQELMMIKGFSQGLKSPRSMVLQGKRAILKYLKLLSRMK
jgi:hypothetical protein